MPPKSNKSKKGSDSEEETKKIKKPKSKKEESDNDDDTDEESEEESDDEKKENKSHDYTKIAKEFGITLPPSKFTDSKKTPDEFEKRYNELLDCFAVVSAKVTNLTALHEYVGAEFKGIQAKYASVVQEEHKLTKKPKKDKSSDTEDSDDEGGTKDSDEEDEDKPKKKKSG